LNPIFANGAITAAFAAAVGEAAANSNGITAARGNGDGVVGARADIENPGATFDSREAAAYDVTSKANALSIDQNREYQWTYYQDSGTGKYGYTDPYQVGLSGGRNVALPMSVNGDSLSNASTFGMGHTHGNYSDAAGNVVSKARDVFDSDKFSRTQ
jgi:hypothetical protein